MSQKNNSPEKKEGILSTLWRWLKRMFLGAGSEYAKEVAQKEQDEKQRAAASDVEEIVSPAKQAFRSFMERKLAVFAALVVIGMFAFVFIAPRFFPNYSDSYTEVTQKSLPPCFSMMSVPKEMRDDIKMISSYGSFSVGLSNAGKVYVWGSTKLGTTGIDIGKIPEEVQNTKIAYVAAGIDHIIAIGENGIVYGWGNDRFGQYGRSEAILNNPNIVPIPEVLLSGELDVANIKKLTCGYQCSAILMNDNTLYLWGNKNTYANIDKFIDNGSLTDVAFTLNYIVGVPKNGKSVYTGTRGLYNEVRENVGGEKEKLSKYLGKRKITELISSSSTLCILLDDGSVCFTGDFQKDSKPMPELLEGEYFVDIGAGSYHFSGLTNLGNVYSWGGDGFGQATVPAEATGVSRLFVGAFQNYAVSETNSLLASWGLKGYLFGTDTYGADIFQRIVNGGKMTMTIGAVAVIISTIIGIVIGCLAGYFGGRVDILLMRLTEIVSSIPFIPFAMILSSIMSQMTLSEDMRIFIIMAILGVLSWPGLARLVRGQILVARESEYVTAAKAMGVREGVIAFKHILPNIISVILVTLTLDFAGCMLTESQLSYLGFGVLYPRPTWGNMLNGANNATIIGNYWWQWVFASLFLAVTTICINIVGDALRDVMDPKSSREK